MELKEQIFAGLCSGIVKIINNPDDDCIACQIGLNWFYFIDSEYEDMTADEIYQAFTKEELAKMIYEQLQDMEEHPDIFDSEVEYYKGYLEDNLTSDVNAVKLAELVDARNKLCAFCKNKEFCEKCQVTRLIDDAYTEYGEE